VAVTISALFFIAMVVIFICQWIVYFRVEQTTLRQQKITKAERREGKEVKD
jgi:dipeptidyl aminopeptidase/acylaminoacyl peptidase